MTDVLLQSETNKLSFLLSRMPESAQIFRVVLGALGGSQTICEYIKSEIDDCDVVASRIVASCDSYVEATEKVFSGQWITAEGRILDTIRWRMNPPAGNHSANQWDGSPEQLIGNLIGKLHDKDKQFLELLRHTLEHSQTQMNSILERNLYLEKQKGDTDSLREEVIRLQADIDAEGGDGTNLARLTGLAEKVMMAQMTNGKAGTG